MIKDVYKFIENESNFYIENEKNLFLANEYDYLLNNNELEFLIKNRKDIRFIKENYYKVSGAFLLLNFNELEIPLYKENFKKKEWNLIIDYFKNDNNAPVAYIYENEILFYICSYLYFYLGLPEKIWNKLFDNLNIHERIKLEFNDTLNKEILKYFLKNESKIKDNFDILVKYSKKLIKEVKK